jgi:sugar phosphate isomerase/epimerase
MKFALSGVEKKYRDASIRVLLDDAQRFGAQGIELWHPGNTAVEGLDQSLKLIEQSGLEVAAVGNMIQLAAPGYDDSRQAALTELVDIAERLEAPFVNTYFGFAETKDDQKIIELYAERLSPCLERAAQAGVIIVIENECDIADEDPAESDVTRTPEGVRALVQHVNSPNFRVTFDAVNFYLAEVEPFPYAYNILADIIAYVHMKDGARYRAEDYADDARLWHEHDDRWYVALPLGEGAVNQEGLLRRLRQDGYEGFLTLEPHVPEAHHDETCANAFRYLRERGYGA